MFNAKASGDGSDREGGDGIEHQVLVKIKSVCVARRGLGGVDKDAGRESVAFLHRGQKHGDIGGRVCAKYEVVDPWNSAQCKHLFKNLMGVDCGGDRNAELVHDEGDSVGWVGGRGGGSGCGSLSTENPAESVERCDGKRYEGNVENLPSLPPQIEDKRKESTRVCAVVLWHARLGLHLYMRSAPAAVDSDAVASCQKGRAQCAKS